MSETQPTLDIARITQGAPIERFEAMRDTRYYAPASGCLIGFADVAGQLGVALMNGAAVPVRDEGQTLHLNFEDRSAGGLEIPAAALTGAAAPQSLVIRQAGMSNVFEKLPAIAPKPADAGKVLLGRYRAEDLAAHAEIRLDDEQLKLRIVSAHGSTKALLEAFTDEVFGCRFDDPGLPMRASMTVERGDGRRVSGLHLNTLRSRRVYFERVGD